MSNYGNIAAYRVVHCISHVGVKAEVCSALTTLGATAVNMNRHQLQWELDQTAHALVFESPLNCAESLKALIAIRNSRVAAPAFLYIPMQRGSPLIRTDKLLQYATALRIFEPNNIGKGWASNDMLELIQTIPAERLRCRIEELLEFDCSRAPNTIQILLRIVARTVPGTKLTLSMLASEARLHPRTLERTLHKHGFMSPKQLVRWWLLLLSSFQASLTGTTTACSARTMGIDGSALHRIRKGLLPDARTLTDPHAEFDEAFIAFAHACGANSRRAIAILRAKEHHQLTTAVSPHAKST